MNAVTPSFARFAEPDTVSLRWAALSDAASLVATLAGIGPEPQQSDEVHGIPALIRSADPWRRKRAEQGIADLSAILEPGIAALMAVNARGTDPRPAALALWREFAAARGAILALLSPASR